MENQDFNSKMTQAYQEMSEKTNNLDMLNEAFAKMLENKQKNQDFDITSLKKIAHSLIKLSQLGEIKRKKRNMVIIEGEITPLSDAEISIIEQTPDNRPDRKEKPSYKYARICADILRRIKDKKIKRFFVLRFVKGLQLQEISAKFGYKPENWTSIGRIQQQFQDIVKQLPKDLIDDLKYYRGIAISYSIPTRFIQGEERFPKEKQRFTWEMLRKEAGECKQLSDFVDDYKEKLDTDDNELIMQAILTDYPMPNDRMPLQIPYRLRITARKQTI